MKKILLILFVAIAMFSSCSKDKSVTPVKISSFKLSLATTFGAIVSSTWQQVLGGEATVAFTPEGTDSLTVSQVIDSLNLKSIATYTKQLLAATYDITLATKSTAAVDTFIRFNAKLDALVFNKDQAASLTATTTDGVITIATSIIGANVPPTFTPAGSAVAYNFGVANGYYFIYVKGGVTGRITFTESTSGDLFLQDLTVAALNQYDISAVLNTDYAASAKAHYNFVVAKHVFQLKTNSFK